MVCDASVDSSRVDSSSNADTAPVVLTVRDDVCVVTLCDGENLFDPEFLGAVHAALDTVENDHRGQALVMTGAAKFFSNGFDLGFLGSLDGETLGPFIRSACGLLARVMKFPAPTVAAINGHAFGIGAMLALAHDQRVMRDDRGWFCLPEVDLGLPFHPFMQDLITSRLSPATATEAILTGRRFSGADARAAGIVEATSNESGLVGLAIEHALRWSGKRPDVLRTMKQQLHARVLAALD